ncbi:MAG: YicC family protein [Planctomycetes bacterium]|nr:YicC family protein [Planctomycetota bacterium]
MIRSMTGFGLAEASEGPFRARVELRSVNHRYLQTKLRLPSELSELESKLEGLVKRSLARGSVTVTVRVERDLAAGDVSVNHEIARRYAKEFQSLRGELGEGALLTAGELAQLPGVVEVSSREGSRGNESKVVLRALKAAIDDLLGSREAEGESMERDLRKNLAAVERLRVRIAKRMPSVVRARQRDLSKRVAALMDQRGPYDGELAREISVLADKLDVSEEVVRLESHVERMSSQLDKGGELGRQLDFLVQEMFREGNTIGSKCNDAKVAHMVVDLKTHIERMREQVQNIE